MAISLFKAFRSTVTPPAVAPIRSTDHWLKDPTTGAIMGVQSDTGNGPNARFAPVDITSAQRVAPSAEMLADLDATFRLNIAPYTRYRSDGQRLIALDNENDIIIPPGVNVILYSPLTIAAPQEMIVYGQVQVRSYPA